MHNHYNLNAAQALEQMKEGKSVVTTLLNTGAFVWLDGIVTQVKAMADSKDPDGFGVSIRETHYPEAKFLQMCKNIGFASS